MKYAAQSYLLYFFQYFWNIFCTSGSAETCLQVQYHCHLLETSTWFHINHSTYPIPLPLIGNLHMVSHKPLHLVLTNLCEKYGNVFSISFGMMRFVITNDIDTTVNTMTLKSFSGRPLGRHFVFLYSRGYTNVIHADYSDDWRKRRKTAQGALRMVSDEHGNTESKIIQESQALHERLRSKAGCPISVRKQFGKAFWLSFFYLFIYLFIYLSIYLFIYSFIYLFTYLFYLSICSLFKVDLDLFILFSLYLQLP